MTKAEEAPLVPRSNPSLFGHAGAEAVLADAARTGRLHHAWLITGPVGVGKATLAYRFARLLFSRGVGANDADNPVFRRVAEATHADLLTVERRFDEKRKRLRAEIGIDDVRAVTAFLHLTPAEGGWRVVVVDGAEHMNRNAANGLLKLLEEPPRRAILLLTCATPGRLLPTIRSRCRSLRLQPLGPADMTAALNGVLPGVEPQARQILAGLARGSPGRGVQLAEAGGVAVASLVSEVLQSAPSLPAARAYEVADRLLRNEAGFTTFMDLLRERLALAVRDAARGQGDRLAATRPLAEWGEVWHALGLLQDETERSNLDKRHAIVAGLELLNAHG